MRILLILLSTFLCFNIVKAQFDKETFDCLDQANGLSSDVVTCMMKDSHGFMWFGTQHGLNKYDGYRFTTYHHIDSLPFSISGNYILSLFEDTEGNIWVGTENSGLNLYDRKKNRFTLLNTASSFEKEPITNSTRDMIQMSDGTIYLGTDRGVITYSPQTKLFSPLVFPESDTSLHSLSIYDLFLDADNSIWIGTTNGLYQHSAEKKQLVKYQHDVENENTLSNNFINCIFRTQEGELCVGTNRGLNVFNETNQWFNRFYFQEESIINEAKSEIQAIAEDKHGNLWVGSFGGGLIKVGEQNELIANFQNNPDINTSISNDYVYSLYYDEAGILWIGTYGGGINKLDQVSIRFDYLEASPNDKNSIISNDIYSILPLEDEVWIGTDQGITKWDKGHNAYYQIPLKSGESPMGQNSVYAMYQDINKNIWVGTSGDGLVKYAPQDYQNNTFGSTYFTSDRTGIRKLVSNEILCLHEDGKQNLWVGTFGGITVIRNDSVIANFINDPSDNTSLADNEVYSIYSDRNGTVWVGTFMGLHRFNPSDSSFVFYENIAGDGAQLNSIYCLFEDSEGYLWAGTDNTGLIKFDSKKEKLVAWYKQEDNLPNNVIYGILEDDEKNLWLSSNKGLIRTIRQEGSSNLTFIHYNSTNWLKNDSYNIGAYAKGKDGIMYFGSFEGLTYFHPENVKGNSYNPPVIITDFQLFFDDVTISDDQSTPLSSHISETNSIHLNYNQNVLRFSFSALNYIHPEDNSYAFMMENLEDNWNYSGNLREAQYMYIPPGEYIFRVKAANNDGVWNEVGTSISITITPPFTQTIWFYLIVIVGLTALVIWVMNIRTRRLRDARSRLEKQVQLRTKELRETNQNLEDEIIERQKVQEALAKSEARFRQLIDTMNEGFSVQDHEGRINHVNPKLCAMFGLSADELLGKFPIDFVDDSSPEYKANFVQERENAIKNGMAASYEMHWKRKDGGKFITMVSPKPIFDKENNYQGSVVVLTDITDLKDAEKQLLAKNKDLNTALDDLRKTQAQLIDSEKMASLGQLTAGVAHEINNPINFVSGNVLPLRRDIEDVLNVLKKYDEVIEKLNLGHDFSTVNEFKEEIDFDFLIDEINNLLDGIGEGASRTAEIVKGLRNFTRMDEHELKIASINQGIDSTLLILHNKIKNRLAIEKEYGDFPDIMCHPGQLNQVFMNLLNNAQEAIEGEGKIKIKTWKENNMVKISISDNGRGIPDNVKKKIFDPFFTTKEVGKGTGLGLSISFGIIEKHNGTIQVNSKKGKGTEFIISIPDNLI